MSKLDRNITAKVRAMIKSQETTQAEVARHIGYTPQRFQAYLSGNRRWMVDTIYRLSLVFKTTMDFWVRSGELWDTDGN